MEKENGKTTWSGSEAQRILFDMQEVLPRATKDKSPGLKFDAEKPSLDLIDGEFLLEMAKVLDFGAKKYATHNWRGGIQWSRTIGAILRHIVAFNNGEDLDPETGLSHIAHAAVNCQFLLWFTKHRKELDDRYRIP